MLLLRGSMRNCRRTDTEMGRKAVKVPGRSSYDPFFPGWRAPTSQGKRRLAPCVYVVIFILSVFLGWGKTVLLSRPNQ